MKHALVVGAAVERNIRSIYPYTHPTPAAAPAPAATTGSHRRNYLGACTCRLRAGGWGGGVGRGGAR